MSFILGTLIKDNAYNHGFDCAQKSMVVFQENIISANTAIIFNSSTQNSISSDSSSNISIIADAVIYNRHELLTSLDHSANSLLSDSQLILQAYIKWGVSCLSRLVGEFAFAIWDTKKNYLFLARDPTGQRPFFYGFGPKQTFYFANSVRLLFDYTKLNNTINLSMLADWLSSMYINNDDTFFSEIKRLAAGHYLIVNPDKHEPVITRYWCPKTFIQNPLVLASSDEYYEQFRHLYTQIIADHLPITNTIACDLSGGLDSSSVTCMAAYLLGQQNRKVIALAHVPNMNSNQQHYDGWNYDDTPFIETVAQYYDNISLNYIRDKEQPLFNYCEQLHPWLEQPIFNPCNMPWNIASMKKARDLGVNTILTGEMGNITLSWSGPGSKTSFLSRLKHFPANIKENFYQRIEGWQKHKPWNSIAAVHDNLAHETNLLQRYLAQENASNAEDSRLAIINTDCGNSFNIASQFLYGINYSDPTYDPRLVEFCLRTPHYIFQNKQGSRLLVRKGMDKLMPQKVCERTCRGLQAADWYNKFNQQKAQIEQKLKSWQKTSIAEYIDINNLLRLLVTWNYEHVSTSYGRKSLSYEYQYRCKLLRAVETGLFIERYL